jgi:hypothetical protein
MAKSEIHQPHVWQAVENRECQCTVRRENDFAISIKSAQEPTSFTLARNEADLIVFQAATVRKPTVAVAVLCSFRQFRASSLYEGGSSP